MKIKRIIFILPDQNRYSCNFSTLTIPGLKLPHLGLCVIGEILRRKGYEIKIVDEKITPLEDSDIEGADLAGISISTVTAVKGYQLAEYIKKKFKIPVVIGGVHATLNPNEAVNYGDYVIRNEGEHSFIELIEALQNNMPMDDVLGLSYKVGDDVYHNAQKPFIKNFDSLPFPNWNLIKGMLDQKVTPLNLNVYSIQCTRGCASNCNFCSITPSFGKECRVRSIDNVIEELKTNRLPSQTLVFFYDDNLVGNKRYLKDLLAAIIDNDIKIDGWHSQMRADVSEDLELLDLMKRTNCIIGTFGFESLNPETLKIMKKGQDPDLIKNCISQMHDHGMAVNGFFVFGYETDDVETVRETVKFAQDSHVDIAGFMPLTPFPGTPLHAEMKEKDMIFSNFWELYDVQHVVYFPEKMTPYELYMETINAYPRFYDIRKKKVIKRRHRIAFWEDVFKYWSVRSYQSYEYEYLANRRYMRFLKSLPDKSKMGKIPEYGLKNETLILHKLLKQRTNKRLMKSVFGPSQRIRKLIKTMDIK